MAVASNSTRAILDRKMHAVGLADVLQTWVSAEDVPRGAGYAALPLVATALAAALGFGAAALVA